VSLKIDIHTHILPERWPDLEARYGYGGFVSLQHHGPGCARLLREGAVFREILPNCWDPGVRLAECDADGIAVQVLSTVPVMFSYWAKPEDALDLSRWLNDHVAEVAAATPERFVGLGTVPMQNADLAIRELERCRGELGLAGIEIGTHVNGQNLDDPAIVEVLRAAEQLGAAVLVHPWEMLGRERMPNYWLPWLVGMPAETALAICSLIFGGVLDELGNLRIAFAHGGGAFPALVGRVEHGYRVRPDLCAARGNTNPRDYLKRLYVDSLVHEPRFLEYLIDLMGADRIAVGSDYPFVLGEKPPGRILEALPLSGAIRDRLWSGTALEWLGLPAERFAPCG